MFQIVKRRDIWQSSIAPLVARNKVAISLFTNRYKDFFVQHSKLAQACGYNTSVGDVLKDFNTSPISASHRGKKDFTLQAKKNAAELLRWWENVALPYIAESRAGSAPPVQPALFKSETEDFVMNVTLKDYLDSFRNDPDAFRTAAVAVVTHALNNNINLDELIAVVKIFSPKIIVPKD